MARGKMHEHYPHNVAPGVSDDRSGVDRSKYPFYTPPADYTEPRDDLSLEVITHAESEEIKGRVQPPTDVAPPEHVVPVRIVQDVRSTYWNTEQLDLPPLATLRIAGAIPGRFSCYVVNTGAAGSNPVYIGADNNVRAGNGFPVSAGTQSPQLKHDKEVWAYNSDTTNTITVAVLSQFNSSEPLVPMRTRHASDHYQGS